MDFSSLYHRNESIYSYATDLKELKITLRTKHNDDIKKVFLIYNSKKFKILIKNGILLMKKLLKNVFSIKNEGVHKVVKICGLKLKLKSKYNRIIQSINELKTENEKQTDILYKKII